jgi:formylglycine-generating enzyme required for sulfatase activity
LLLSAAALAGETPPFPLWDGVESISSYGQRTGLPEKQKIDLGGGRSLELVLVPAGQFVMGVAPPERPKFTMQGGLNIIWTGVVLVALILAPIIYCAIRQRRRPQISLARFFFIMLACSLSVYGGVRYSQAKKERQEYVAAAQRYNQTGYHEKPARTVTITRPFYIGKFEVTQDQYEQVMHANPSRFRGGDLPADSMAWEEACGFCDHISGPRRVVRLPTEAEWEYACRAGTKTKAYSGDDQADIDRVAWYQGTPQPVGQKEANAFGLYDMLGNVWEWCSDWYQSGYNPAETVDPKGPSDGSYHAIRGGSWMNGAYYCRFSSRWDHAFGPTSPDVGFRVVMQVPGEQKGGK